MKDSSFISAMFEEIKSKISSLEKKLEQMSVRPAQPATMARQDENRKKMSVEELLGLVQKTIIYSTQKESQQALTQINDSKKELREGINDLSSNLKNLKCYRKKIKKDAIGSNLRIWQIGSIMVVVLLLLCIGVLKLETLRLADNDLKYRYIYSVQSIDSTGLQSLETIFHVNRDKEFVKTIRQNVQEYELRAKKKLGSNRNIRNTEPEANPE